MDYHRSHWTRDYKSETLATKGGGVEGSTVRVLVLVPCTKVMTSLSTLSLCAYAVQYLDLYNAKKSH
jgi:hypothetical protein